MAFQYRYVLPEYTHEAYEKYCDKETDWMAAEGYADSKEALLRKKALCVIFQISKDEKLDAFIPYLAMNIFDRFLSRHQLPYVLWKLRDDLVLAAHCCLAMAWKMRDFDTFSFEEFVEKRNLGKDYIQKLMKMHGEIIMTQKWHTRAVTLTPVCFLGFFASKVPIGRRIKRRSLVEIIIQSQGDIDFTRFRPSVIAASAVLAAGRLQFGNKLYERNKRFLLARKFVRRQELEACLAKTYELCIEKKILLERDEEPKVNGEVGETCSSSSHRPGTEPMHEEIEEKPKITKQKPRLEDFMVPEMKFELKWMMWRSDDLNELTIDSPVFRDPKPAPESYDGSWVQTGCCSYFWPPCSRGIRL